MQQNISDCPVSRTNPKVLSMDVSHTTKSFIASALEYRKHRSEDVHNTLCRQLQIMSVAQDSVFDPGSSIAVEFFVSLHELMSILDSRSPCLWDAVQVLRHACGNPAARQALIHTYKFVPILSKLLCANLIEKKKIKVLRLLQELTYGVKISWQEAHLPQLISVLTSWVVNGEREVITLSLGVLVNLCYKNLPAVYTLMRSVESKEFLRTILNLRNNDINTSVQVCKLLIILEHISGEIPEADILNFVNVTFSAIGGAFKARDVFLLKHMVDFFKDLQTNDHSREVLLKYDRFPADTEQLLLVLSDTNSHPGCVAVLLEFLHSLIRLQINGLYSLFPRLVACGMHWLTHKSACTQSLLLIRSVVMDARHGGGDAGSMDVQQNILGQLDQGLTKLLKIITEEFSLNAETRTQLTALLQLLQEMTKTPLLRQKVLLEVKPQTLQKIFQPLLSVELRQGGNLFEEEVTALYVHALDFMSDLTSHNASWLKLYSELLQHKQVQMVLALGLFTGKEEIKRRVLSLAGTVGFPAESISLLAKSLCDLEPLVLVTNNPEVGKPGGSSGNGCSLQQYDMMPLFSLAQEGRLDKILRNLEEALGNNQIHNVSTSAVMELYEYRLAAMGHSERALQASLEAADTHSTRLKHRLAQMSAEAGKLHQLLYHNQQCLQGLKIEKEALNSKNEALKQAAEEDHNKHINKMKSLRSELDDLTSEINELKISLNCKNEELTELKHQLENLMKQLEDSTNQLVVMDQNYKEQLSKNSELTKTLGKLEERIAKRQKVIDDNGYEINKLKETIQNFEMELVNFKKLSKAQENKILEKEEEISVLKSQLHELERMREVIFEISAGRKKMDK